MKNALEGRLGANGSLRLFLVAPLLPVVDPAAVVLVVELAAEGEREAGGCGSLMWTEEEALW